MVLIFFLLQVPDRETTRLPTWKKLFQLDFVGLSMLLPGVVCLLLALQWGGLKYAWSNGRIIALLTLGGVLLVGFIAVQILMPDTATIPPRIFVQRSIIAGFWSTFCIGASMMIMVYYLPIWFQAIDGVDAVNSGIRLLPMVLSMVTASISSGVLVSKLGYYTPVMIFGVVLMSTGAGLLTTLQVGTGEGRWVGYQIIYGFGLGSTFQAPNLAAQTALPTRDVPVGTSLMLFSQLLSGAIFISVAQNVLDGDLLADLAGGVPGFDASSILDAGATTITALPEPLRSVVLVAYNAALRTVFRVGLVMTCLTVFGAAAMEWRSVKSRKPVEGRDGAGKDASGAENGVSGATETGTGTETEKGAGTGSVADDKDGVEGLDEKGSRHETGTAALGSGPGKETAATSAPAE